MKAFLCAVLAETGAFRRYFSNSDAVASRLETCCASIDSIKLTCIVIFSRLPLPWFLYSMLSGGKAYTVNSQGMFCSTVLLFAMLLMVVTTIAVCGCRMNKSTGVAMFILYIFFLVATLLLEYGILNCAFYA